MEENILNNAGAVFYGRTTLQMRGSIGGTREVFVPLVEIKNHLVFPTTGGFVTNPFKTMGKMYAGDLVEYHWNGQGVANKHQNAEVILLKTFEVHGSVEAAATTVNIVRNGFRHKPEVGNILMKAPDSFDATGSAATVTAVKKTKVATTDVWELTLSAAIGALVDGDVLVEGTATGADATMLVKNPNAMLPCDYDFKYTPAVDDDDFDGARYYLTPTLHGLTYVHLMSPMPKVVLDISKSRIDGWFEI